MIEGNLISIDFTDAELKTIDDSLAAIIGVLKGKTFNLTPEERRQYGRIAEKGKLFVNKANEYMNQYPQYIPPFLNYDEFKKDFKARGQIENRLIQLEGIAEQLADTKVMLDYDNYSNALSFYRNIRYLSGENVPGTTSIYEGMKQFFTGGRSLKQEEPAADDEERGEKSDEK